MNDSAADEGADPSRMPYFLGRREIGTMIGPGDHVGSEEDVCSDSYDGRLLVSVTSLGGGEEDVAVAALSKAPKGVISVYTLSLMTGDCMRSQEALCCLR